MGWEDAPLVSKPAWESAPLVAEPTLMDNIKQGTKNLVAGAVRGTGSIGATILAPVDMVKDAIDGKGVSLESNKRRRADMDAALSNPDLPVLGGAEPDSALYQTGKLGGEIAGTAGVGSALAAGAKAAGAAAPVVEALTSGGLSAGGVTGAPGLALRAGAGAVTGAATAGLVDPHSAGEGALVGAAIPVAAKTAGAALRAAGNKLGGASTAATDAAATQKLNAARTAANAGYVLPPSDIPGSSTTMRVLGGLSGKIKTSQVASERNQEVTNALVRRALGLPEDAVLSQEVLDAVRAEAGKAYADVAKLGPMDAAGAKLPAGVNVQSNVTDMLTLTKSTKVDASELVRAWKQANHDATGYYRAYARDANPETLAKAKAAADAAKQIDAFMATKLEQMGKSDLRDALKAARERIAKTYNAEAALNLGNGNISAPKLAAQLEKGKPLSGELRTIAEVSSGFPKATQALREAPGQVSALDFFAARLDPFSVLTLGGRPAARAAVLSKPAQASMLRQAPSPVYDFFSREALPAAARSAPVLLANP